MNFRRDFEIAFVGLKPGIHHYEYEVGDEFFLHFDKDKQEFTNCTATVKLALDKKSSFMLLKFDVDGTVNVTCDRCGNPLPLRLWEEFNVMVKLVDDPDEMNAQEEDPDVYYISRGESHLHLADWIYEFINLSIPLQKMCPPEEMGGPQCNKEALARLANLENNDLKNENPLWKGLDQFKNLK